jgi:long-chain acyl-CoA synthetase
MKVAAASGLDPNSERVMRGEQAEKLALERVQRQIKSFPGYAQVYRVAILTQPWTIENGMLTPTMKLKRAKVMEVHQKEFEQLYEGH